MLRCHVNTCATGSRLQARERPDTSNSTLDRGRTDNVMFYCRLSCHCRYYSWLTFPLKWPFPLLLPILLPCILDIKIIAVYFVQLKCLLPISFVDLIVISVSFCRFLHLFIPIFSVLADFHNIRYRFVCRFPQPFAVLSATTQPGSLLYIPTDSPRSQYYYVGRYSNTEHAHTAYIWHLNVKTSYTA